MSKINKGRIKVGALIFSLLVVSLFIFFTQNKANSAGTDLEITANTTWAAGTQNLGNLTISNNAVLTLQSSLNGTAVNYDDDYGVTVNADNIVVNAGSTISADAQGYAGGAAGDATYSNGAGPGGGKKGDWGAGGASHAGAGGTGYTGLGSTVIYGSSTEPVTFGSGGGGAGNASTTIGGKGGGAIKLVVAGTLTNNGSISADGSAGVGTSGGVGSGGGAGGSIWVICDILSGVGEFTANGGAGGTIVYTGGGGGGGGRISLDPATSDTFTGSIIVAAGAGKGGAVGGSIYRDAAASLASLTLAQNTTWTCGTHTFANLTINSGVTLTTGIGTTGALNSSEGNAVSGGGTGPGFSGYYGAGGAGHGGAGGAGYQGSAGGVYGSSTEPVTFGSGGGGTHFGGGGNGGGALKLVITGTLTNDGTISADGSNGVTDGGYAGAGAAGGSGGSIWIDTTNLTNTSGQQGVFSAKGGNGAGTTYGGGGGGGGRLAFYFDSATGFNPSSITVAGGAPGKPGGAGTAGTIYGLVYSSVTAPEHNSYKNSVTAVSGVAADYSGGTLSSVSVSIKNNVTNQYYGGSAFDAGTTENWLTASGTTSWSYAIANSKFTSGSSYTVHSRCTNGTITETPGTGATFNYDSTAPNAPVITSIGGNNIIVAAEKSAIIVVGTAEANALVNVTLADAGSAHTVTGSQQLFGGGTDYSITINGAVLNEGVITPAVTATDIAGNTSTAAATPTATVDTIAPNAPVITSIGGADNIINNVEKPAIIVVGTAEAGSTINVSLSDSGNAHTVTGSGTATGGAYSITINGSTLNDGVITPSITSTDAAGNVSTAAATPTATLDTTAPNAPVITSIGGADNIINNAEKSAIIVVGTAEANALVNVTLADVGSAHTVTGSQQLSGGGTAYSITIDGTTLADGVITPSVTSADSVGNVSVAAVTPTAIKDIVLPSAPIAPMAAAGPLINAAEELAGFNVVAGLGTSGAVAGDTLTLLLDGANFPTPLTHTLEADLINMITWAERQPAGNVDKNWADLASSSDGTKLIAVNGNRLYTSTDSGATWAERQPAGNVDKNWYVVASNSDGTKLIAGLYYGSLYSSSDSGATWTERRPAGAEDKFWFALASSSDGTKLIAAAYYGHLYTSTNSGVTWTERQPAGSDGKNWYAVASSSDGTKLIAGVDGGRLYTSTDSGATWAERQPAGNVDKVWYSVASSSDGTKLIAGSNNRLYTSTNSGATWTERQPGGDIDRSWFALASSSDGTKLIAGVYYDRLYTSSDSGATWTERQPAGDDGKAWFAVASSSDGTKLIAAVNGGRLYTAVIGSYTFTIAHNQLGVDGAKSITSTVTDIAGNLGAASSALALTLDTTAPNAPVITSIGGADNIISGAEKSAIIVVGTAEANALVSVTLADVGSAHTVTGSQQLSGGGTAYSITIDGSTLNDGVITPSVTSTDAAGNVSTAAATPTATLDTTAPNAPVITSIGGADNIINNAEKSAIIVVGTAEANALVNVTLADVGSAHTVTGSQQLSGGGTAYSITIDGTTLADGVITPSVTSADSVGNVSVAAVTPTAIKDIVLPSAPIAPMAAAGPLINAAEELAGFNVVAGLGTSGAVAGDTLTLLLDGVAFPTPLTHTLEAVDLTSSKITWSEAQPAGVVDKYWRAAASNSDGTKLIVGVDGGRLYTSSDSGATWTERQPAGNGDKSWYSVASSSDGTKLIAAVYYGRLYTSSDSGVNWTERQPVGNVDKGWAKVASSSDGTKLIIGAHNGRLYTSTDSGATWTERQPAGAADKTWNGVASSSDGMKLIAAVFGGRLYTSTDSGATWTERQPAGEVDDAWRTVVSNGDGTKLIADTWTRLYTSNDSGVTWTEAKPAGEGYRSWNGAASSSDGTKLIAGIEAGRLYISTDSGVTWIEAQPAGAVDKTWVKVAFSSDGTKLIAGAYGGRLYTGSITTGYYTFNIAYNQLGSSGTKAITSTVTDIAGNLGAASDALSLTLDLAAPNAPTITSIGGADNIISGAEKSAIIVVGTAEANALVSVTLADVGSAHTVTGSQQLSGGGTAYSITINGSALNEGVITPAVTATDAAGNVSTAAATPTATIDSTAPAAPTITSIGGADNIINNSEKSAIIVVGTAEAGSTVNVSLSDADSAHTVTGSGTATGGTYSITIDGSILNEGVITPAVTATDAAGNTSTVAATPTAVKDTVLPGTPAIPIAPSPYVNIAQELAGFNVVAGLGTSGAVAGDSLNLLLDGVAFPTPLNHTLEAADFTAEQLVWTERQPTGNVNRAWNCVASNSDGTKLIIGADNGRLYTSSDSGATWIERQPAGNVNRVWESAAFNSDGTKLIVGAWWGRLYTSTDSGVTWTERRPAGNVNMIWYSVASSSDGTKLIASASDGHLYTSSDSGVTWTERQPVENFDKNWSGVASSSDGTKLIIASYGRRLYTSSDSGATWTERQPAGDVDEDWVSVASNSDGTKLIAGAWWGGLYTSSDSGVTWTGGMGGIWVSVASNSDGTKLIAASYWGNIYISTDGGTTWAKAQLIPEADGKDWLRVASNSDGTRLMVSAEGRLYIGSTVTGYYTFNIAHNQLGASGAKAITASVTDLGANTGAASDAFNLTLDLAAPNAPVITSIGGTDNIINNAEKSAIIVVGTAEANALVSVTLSDAGSAHTVSGTQQLLSGATSYSITINGSTLNDGTITPSVTATDAAGNPSTAVTTPVAIKDVVLPNAPNAPTAAAGPYINIAEELAGFPIVVNLGTSSAVAGDTLTLLLNAAAFPSALNHVLEAADIVAGNYSFTIAHNQLGVNGAKSISAKITDVAGNVGATSEVLTLTLDAVAPLAPNAPTAAAGPYINIAEELAGFPIVVNLGTSSAVAGDTLTLLLNAAAFPSALNHVLEAADIVAGNYSFTIAHNQLGVNGAKSITSTVTDIAGNLGAASDVLTLTLDTVVPTVSSVTATSVNAAGDTIAITFPEEMDATTITSEILRANSTIGLQYSDNAGNTNQVDIPVSNATVNWSVSKTIAIIVLDEAIDSAYLPDGKYVGVTFGTDVVKDAAGNSVVSDEYYSAIVNKETLAPTITNVNAAYVASGNDTVTFTANEVLASVAAETLNNWSLYYDDDTSAGGEIQIVTTNASISALDASKKILTITLNEVADGAYLPNGKYIKVVPTSNIRDLVGNFGVAPVWTVAPIGGDTVAPTFTVNATSVHAGGDTISLTFNEVMDTTTLSDSNLISNLGLTYSDNAGAIGRVDIVLLHAQVAWDSTKKIATITLNEVTDGAYIPDAKYIGALPVAGNIKDLSGNAAEPTRIYTQTSVTKENTPPVISSTSPATSTYTNNARVSYTLSEFCRAGAGSTITWTKTSGSADAGSPHVQQLTGSELSAGAHNNITLTNNPTLVNGALYTVTFTAVDLVGNAATPVLNTNITYDTASPVISSASVVSNNSTPTLAKAGDTITYSITYSKPVTAAIFTASTANNIATAVTADASASNSATDSIVFTVASGDNGAVTPENINFNITDSAGNATAITNLGIITGTVTADTAVPTVSSITTNLANDQTGIVSAGAFSVTTVFSESMKASVVPVIVYDPTGPTGPQESSAAACATGGGWSVNNTTYKACNVNGITSATGDGTAVITISAAEDLAANVIASSTKDFNITTTAADLKLTAAGTGDSGTYLATVTAGTPVDLVVTIKDTLGNVKTDYTGTIRFESNDAHAQASLPVNYTFTAADAGRKVFSSGATLITKNANAYIKVTDLVFPTVTFTKTFEVNSAPSSRYALTSPADITAGSRAAYTVTRYDRFDNLSDTAPESVYLFTSNPTISAAGFYDASIAGNPIARIVMDGNQSSANFWYYDTKAGTWTITASDTTPADGTPGVADVTDSLTVVPASASKYKIGSETTTMTAGESAAITIRAYDTYDNVAVSYIGGKTLYFFGANASTSPVTSPTATNTGGAAINFGNETLCTFDEGVATSTIKLYKREGVTVKVQNTVLSTVPTITTADADDLEILVNGGDAQKLSWYIQPEATAVANAPWKSFAVSVTDAYGNVSPSAVEITVTPSAGIAVSAACTNTVNANSGVATFSNFGVYAIDGLYSKPVKLTASTGSISTEELSDEVSLVAKYVIVLNVRDSVTLGSLNTVSLTITDVNGDVVVIPTHSSPWTQNSPFKDDNGNFALSYGKYNITLTKDDYVSAAYELTADATQDGADSIYDNSITWNTVLTSVAESMADYQVKADFVYDEIKDILTVTQRLERRGQQKISDGLNNLGTATLEIYDGATLIGTLSDTVADAQGNYWYSVTSATTVIPSGFTQKFESGKTYYVKCKVAYGDTGGNRTTYASGTTFLINISQSLKAVTDAIQTVTTGIASQTSSIQKTVKDEIEGQIKGVVLPKIAEVKSETANILTATGTESLQTKLDDVKTQVVEQVQPHVKSSILNRESAVKRGDKVAIRYRTDSGLAPVLSVYGPKDKLLLSSKVMAEVGLTGIYEYTVTFNWVKGDYTVICTEPTKGTVDALVITIRDTDIEEVSGSVSAVLGGTSGITGLKGVAAALSTQFSGIDKILAQISRDTANKVNEAKGVVNDLSETVKQLSAMSKQIKDLGGTKGINLEKLYDVSKDKNQDITYIKNKSEELKAAMELNQKMIENVAKKPVVQSWFEFK